MEDIKFFLNTEFKDNIALTDEYTKIAGKIMYSDPELIVAIISKLKSNIINFALSNTVVYKNYKDKIYTREDFLNKNLWYAKHLTDNSKIMKTSGSTSGSPFSYMIYKRYYNFIENTNQYGLILEEFDISKNHIKILVLANLHYNPSLEENQFFLVQDEKTTWALHNHGSENSTKYFVNFNDYEDMDDWYKKLLDLLDKNFFDVILTTGPIINSLVYYLKKYGYNKKICKLINQTCEYLILDDVEFLKKNNYIDNYCDSMRCWDGGATFFTCKYNVYHLMDNLSFVESIDNKLVSTDYFSFAAPFINYWNGDLCELENGYQLCKCGRYYRKFKMLENRPFGLKGPTKLTQIKQEINKLSFSKNLVQIKFDNFKAIIISNESLVDEEKIQVMQILKDYNCIFFNH